MRTIDVDSAPYTSGDAMRWAVAFTVAAVDTFWVLCSPLTVARAGIGSRAQFEFSLVSILVPMALIRYVRRRRGVGPIRFSREIELTLHATLYWSFASAALGLLQYLLVTINPPLLDQTLDAIDKAAGFDWIALNNWITAHQGAKKILDFAYRSIAYQCIGIPLFFCLTYDVKRLGNFNSQSVLTILLTLIVSAALPAHTASIYYHAANAAELATQTDFDALRAGMLTINLDTMQGIITMPSLHAALAFGFAYSVRGTRIFMPIAALNAVMAFSTLTEGGHYLIDALAGIGVAILSISLLTTLTRSAASATPTGARR